MSAAVSEDVRNLVQEITAAYLNGKYKKADQLLADALQAATDKAESTLALSMTRHIQTGPREGCKGLCCKTLRKLEQRVRLDEADQWNAMLKVQDLRACDILWATQRISELRALAEGAKP